jgi:hypothetical protein
VNKTKYIKAGSHFEVAVTTDRSGRMSIVVTEKPYLHNRTIIDVELPAQTGEYANAFKPTVHKTKDIDIKEMS